MNTWVEFTFLLESMYKGISKDSIVNVNGQEFLLKRIDRITLLGASDKAYNTVHVYARGIKL